MKNPIILKDGKYRNTKTGHYLSDSYGSRLHSYYRRFPDTLLKAARGHREQLRPGEVPVPEYEPAILEASEPDDHARNGGQRERNLKIWGRRELERWGYL